MAGTLLPIPVRSRPETSVAAISPPAREMGAVNRLILFGRGRVPATIAAACFPFSMAG
jgi:hypothetical protein